jgi:hypothetical protein
MLEHFYQSSKQLLRLRQAPLGAIVDGLADRFHRFGYSKRYSQRILWIVGKVNNYARALGIKSAAGLNLSLLQRFMENRNNCGFAVSIAMHHLRKQLCDQGMVQMTRPLVWMIPAKLFFLTTMFILATYVGWLCRVAHNHCATHVVFSCGFKNGTAALRFSISTVSMFWNTLRNWPAFIRVAPGATAYAVGRVCF